MNHCEDNDSPWAALLAAALSLVTFARIPPDHLLRLQPLDVCNGSISTQQNCKAVLTKGDGRFLRRWMELRGSTPGPLLSFGVESPPLSLGTISASLAKTCREVGVRPFSMEDLSRTQAWISCGEWAYPCGCDLQASAQASFPDGRPSDIPRVQYLRRMESPKRREATKLLNAFCRELKMGTTLASLDWHRVSPSRYGTAISNVGATYPQQKVRAIRKYVDAIMHAERACGSLREAHYWDLQAVPWKKAGNQNAD